MKKTKKMEDENTAKKEEDESKQQQQQQQEEEESEEEASMEDEGRGRGKRKRKSSLENSFAPEDFSMADKKTRVTIIQGRGKQLQAFPEVVASLEHASTDDVLMAHKFLFGNKGSHLKKKELVENLLEFSGYLKEAPDGYDEKKLEAEDEAEEKKYSTKAFKMVLAQVKQLCEIFHVVRHSDDGKPLNKEDTIENLLDFLGQPHADFIANDRAEKSILKKKAKATPKKKKSPTKVAKAVTTSTTSTVESSFQLVRAHKKGKMPSDHTLRQWVKAYVVCFDMDSATTKHAIKTASDKFGVDLTGNKDRIKELLADEI